MNHALKALFRRLLPGLYYHAYYAHGIRKLGDKRFEANRRFADLLANSQSGQCLQIGVKENIGRKYGTNWVAVDLYDTRPFIDFHYDIHELEFADSMFDAVVCMSIIEHVRKPWVAVSELRRVLKPQGLLWLQAPLAYPYHPDPQDFWRFSPDALRILCEGFEEIDAGVFTFVRSSLVASSYFYGRKL